MKLHFVVIGCVMLTTHATAQNGKGDQVIPSENLLAIGTPTTDYYEDYYYLANNEVLNSGRVAAYYEEGVPETTGYMVKGKRSGKWFKYAADGTLLYEATFANGLRHGAWKAWHSNGTLLMVAEFNLGRRVGEWRRYNASGRLIEKRNYGTLTH